MEGNQPLKAWLLAQRVSQQELARRVGCSDVHVGRIANGSPRVSLALSIRIFDETGVRVGPLANSSAEDIAAFRRLESARAA